MIFRSKSRDRHKDVGGSSSNDKTKDRLGSNGGGDGESIGSSELDTTTETTGPDGAEPGRYGPQQFFCLIFSWVKIIIDLTVNGYQSQQNELHSTQYTTKDAW